MIYFKFQMDFSSFILKPCFYSLLNLCRVRHKLIIVYRPELSGRLLLFDSFRVKISARSAFTSGLMQFETFPQLLQVGETVHVADTFLLTTKYPTEVSIPPTIRRRPVVLKNSFLFMVMKTEDRRRETEVLVFTDILNSYFKFLIHYCC